MLKPFDVHYAHGRTSVVIKANLETGWTRLKKTYGFFRSCWVPYKDDLKVRVQLALIAQPGTHNEWAKQFPDLEFETGDEAISYRLHAKELAVTVSLSASQSWRATQQGRPELFIEKLPLTKLDSTHWFDLRVWIVFHELGPPRVPDVRAWVENRLFVPGGQIESNRRHH